jgi:hypothetical protein
MTHAEAPWKDHFQEDERHIVIPNDGLKEFFAQRRVGRLS